MSDSADLQEEKNDVPMESDEEDEDKYVVERIVDKRVRNKKTEYFIKWKNYEESDNTWEPEENCDCPELIAQFEEERRKKNADLKKRKLSTKKNGGQTSQQENKPNGFDRGLTVDKIIGATDAPGQLMFLIKWYIRLLTPYI